MREYILQRKIKEYMKGHCDKQITDDQGDLINVINEDSDVKILLASHSDEISLIVDGLSNQEISEKLVVSISTTKAHVHNILQKLYLTDRTKAAIVALKEGLV